ncbi:MAG: DUF3108 domain-containing protein [Nitrospinota bacterium]
MRKLTRVKRIRLAALLAGILLAAALLKVDPSGAEGPNAVLPPKGERLVYDVSFLLFRNAAVGSLTMRYLPARNLYEGVVSAQTKGFVGLFSFFRRDTYRSLMRLSPEGRLIPIEFHKKVRQGGYRLTTSTFLDYKAGVMRWKSTMMDSDGTDVETQTRPIPKGFIYEDFISAFSNLRRGVYGPIVPGKVVQIPSLPTRNWFKKHKEKPQSFTVKLGKWTRGEDGSSRMEIAITVPKGLFGGRVEHARFQMREDHVPSGILLKDAILSADVKGKLRSSQVFRKELAAESSPPAP